MTWEKIQFLPAEAVWIRKVIMNVSKMVKAGTPKSRLSSGELSTATNGLKTHKEHAPHYEYFAKMAFICESRLSMASKHKMKDTEPVQTDLTCEQLVQGR